MRLLEAFSLAALFIVACVVVAAAIRGGKGRRR